MQKPRCLPGLAEYSEKEGRVDGDVVLGWGGEGEEDGEDHVTREGLVSIQGAIRAPLRLRHWVHWHVWVFFARC